MSEVRLASLVTSPVVKGAKEPHPYLALEHIESGTGRLVPGTIPEEKADRQAVKFNQGDVLFGKLRPYLQKVVQASAAGAASSELLVLRPGPGLYGRFLYYLALSQPFLEWANASSYGVKMPRTSWEVLGHYRFVPPALEAQRLIAEFLDRETGRVDALVEAKRKLIDLLAEKRTSLITHAVTKGLDPTVPMKESGVEWIGQIPAHWQLKPLRRLVDPGRPITYGIVLPGPNVDVGIPIIKSGDVKPGRLALERLDRTTEEIERSYERSRVYPGDLVYSIRGSVGAVEPIPDSLPLANLTQDTARIAPGPDVNPRWLLQTLRSRSFFSQLESTMTGSAVKGFNIWRLNKALVPTPPVSEQQQIADVLGRRTSLLANALQAVERQLALLTEYRQALIAAAVTGQLDDDTLKGRKPSDEAMEFEVPA